MEKLRGLYQLADDDNIGVFCFRIEAAESMAINQGEKCYIAIDSNKLKSVADETVKLGHELGHCETGCFYTRYCLLETRERCEYRANKWAIRQLIPKDELYGLYRNGYTEPWEIAEQMNLPESFVIKAMKYYHDQDLADEKIRPRRQPEAD